MQYTGKTTTEVKIRAWKEAMPLLVAMFGQFKELSKKRAADVVSKGKISVVNRLVVQCREVLSDEDSIGFLDELNEDDLPQNNDVVIMLSQYVAAMEQFEKIYHVYYRGKTTWRF